MLSLSFLFAAIGAQGIAALTSEITLSSRATVKIATRTEETKRHARSPGLVRTTHVSELCADTLTGG